MRENLTNVQIYSAQHFQFFFMQMHIFLGILKINKYLRINAFFI